MSFFFRIRSFCLADTSSKKNKESPRRVQRSLVLAGEAKFDRKTNDINLCDVHENKYILGNTDVVRLAPYCKSDSCLLY